MAAIERTATTGEAYLFAADGVALGTERKTEVKEAANVGSGKPSVRQFRFPEEYPAVRVKKTIGKYDRTYLLLDDGQAFPLPIAAHKSGKEDAAELAFWENVESQGERIVDIGIGKDHVLGLTSSGKVFAYGKNAHGQLGNAKMNPRESIAQVIGLPPKSVVQIAAGNALSAAVCANGDVYTWGQGAQGQLGTGNEVQLVPRCVIKLSGTRIVAVDCGETFCVALSAAGEVFFWGTGPTLAKQHFPTKMELPLGIKAVQVSCGYDHVVIVAHDGSVFGFGLNEFGQLGLPVTSAPSFTQLQLEERPRISQVACGKFCTYFLTVGGNILSLGRSLSGNATSGETNKLYGSGQYSQIAACNGGLVAFTDTTIDSISPTVLSASGGVSLTLRGSAFCATSSTPMVRFETDDGRRVDVPAALDKADERITCITPAFGAASSLMVSLSLDGVAFTNSLEARVFRVPDVSRGVQLQPSSTQWSVPTSCSLTLAIDPVHYPAIKLRFSSTDAAVECSGECTAQLVSSPNSSQTSLEFVTPVFRWSSAQQTKAVCNVDLSLDGQQWIPLGPLLTVVDATANLASSPLVTYNSVGTAVRLDVKGIHYSNELSVQITHSESKQTLVVPGFFTSNWQLQQQKHKEDHLRRVAQWEEQKRQAETAAQEEARRAEEKKKEQEKQQAEANAKKKRATKVPNQEPDQTASEQKQAEASSVAPPLPDPPVLEPLPAPSEDDLTSGFVESTVLPPIAWSPAALSIALSQNSTSYGNTGVSLQLVKPIVRAIMPSCGPVTGDTEVKLYGIGLYDAPDGNTITIKAPGEAVAASIASTYGISASCELDEAAKCSTGTPAYWSARRASPHPDTSAVSLQLSSGMLCAALPAAAKAGIADIAVPDAGSLSFFYYDDPVLEGFAPASVQADGTTLVTITGEGLVRTDQATVKLALIEDGKETRSEILRASYQQLSAEDLEKKAKKGAKDKKKPADAAPVEDVAPAPDAPLYAPGVYTFAVPDSWSEASPCELQVSLSLNGQQYINLEKKLKLEKPGAKKPAAKK